MGLIAKRPDIIDRQIEAERQQRRMRTAQPGRAVANFIMKPIAIDAFPPALAPPRCRVIGVMVRAAGGGSVSVDMYVVRADPPSDEPNPFLLHSFTAVAADGAVHYEEAAIDLELLDYMYPDVTAGAGTELTASFIVAP